MVATDLQFDMWASFFTSCCAVTLAVVVGFERFFGQIELTVYPYLLAHLCYLDLIQNTQKKGSQAFFYVVVLL